MPQSVYLSFATEAERDEYVRRLEALLNRGVVPEELTNTKAAAKDLRSQVTEYRSAQHTSVDDEQLLPVFLSRLPIGITLPQLTFTWATEWVTTMKPEQNLAPSTIRHYVGALSRALDWLAAHGAPPMNPLRLLPWGYSTYTADDKIVVKRIDGDPTQLSLLKPTAGGPRQFEVSLNGHVWTGVIESFQKQREFADGGARLSGRSRTALLAAPYAPARVKVANEDRSMAQLVAEELADTGFTSQYETVDWTVLAGAWFYDASTPLDAISALAEASGAVVQSHPQDLSLHVRASYPVSPWLWRDTQPAHVVQEDIVLTESLQMRSAPLYDAVVVTGEIPGKGVTCKVRKAGEAGQLYAQQVSSRLISVAAAGAERGRNVLSDRGEQAAVDLTVPLFPKPLKAGKVGAIMPLDLVEVVAAEGTWHGQCESLRIEVVIDQQAVVIEQAATLERHYTDADWPLGSIRRAGDQQPPIAGDRHCAQQ
ncbi:hypothetical protein [Stenotrophomonas maltophilia]|uniref:hypothetical protein n=1 Tax=Stenotrophomonas maltophilia TaxID=40324 RepID=UPI001EE3D9A7|nr:hypothetical protein [Stenotrophomonas maltophilia]